MVRRAAPRHFQMGTYGRTAFEVLTFDPDLPQKSKKPCPRGSGHLYRYDIWFRWQALNLRPADPSVDWAANDERISGYGA
jgi:hypothetical protein